MRPRPRGTKHSKNACLRAWTPGAKGKSDYYAGSRACARGAAAPGGVVMVSRGSQWCCNGEHIYIYIVYSSGADAFLSLVCTMPAISGVQGGHSTHD